MGDSAENSIFCFGGGGVIIKVILRGKKFQMSTCLMVTEREQFESENTKVLLIITGKGKITYC